MKGRVLVVVMNCMRCLLMLFCACVEPPTFSLPARTMLYQLGCEVWSVRFGISKLILFQVASNYYFKSQLYSARRQSLLTRYKNTDIDATKMGCKNITHRAFH